MLRERERAELPIPATAFFWSWAAWLSSERAQRCFRPSDVAASCSLSIGLLEMNEPAPSVWTMTNPSRRWGIISLTLLLVAGACLWVGLRGHQVLSAAPARHPPSLATGITSIIRPGADVTTPVAARSLPVSLRIPAIGVAVAVSTLGLNPDGTVEVPTDFQKPGWYRLGPSPGQMGSAVILGHVDSYQGPAVFFRLRSLAAGDPVEVTLADGVVADFVVTSVAMYSKAQFPSQQVYGSHGNGELQLVTCGGTFDTRTRSYLSNIVVYTSLQDVTGVSHQPTQR